MLVRLTLLCSGATLATRKGLFPRDEPIEEQSRIYAAGIGAKLRRADRVWTSPALRARQTAEPLSPLPSVEPLLADQDHGRWAGKSFEQVEAEAPGALAAWLADPGAASPGGESLREVSDRISGLMDGLLAEPGHTIMVTHAAVIRLAILHVLGAELSASRKIDIEPLSITEIRSDGHRWMLRSSGVIVHKRT